MSYYAATSWRSLQALLYVCKGLTFNTLRAPQDVKLIRYLNKQSKWTSPYELYAYSFLHDRL